MNRTVQFLVVMMVMCLSSSGVWANSAPVVSSVSASQRGDDSKLVDIYYDLADADGDTCTVWVAVSSNAGQSWSIPARSLSGDIGQGIVPGANKHVLWDAGADVPGKEGSFMARVFADDGNGPSAMVLVPAGPFPYQNGPDWIQVDSFVIDKYEVTNQRYCQFLNNGDPDGNNWDGNMEIDRFGDPGAYSYAVHPGKDNYPVRYVNFYDVEAFAAWKSSQTGLTYRLATEQEWEKAAGWDPVLQKLWAYGFQSDSIDCSRCNYAPCVGGPTVVGSYDPQKSYYGCYDMSGNLWEWTSSIYSGSSRALRGGNWSNNATSCQVTYRLSETPSSRTNNLGFRLVLDFN